MKEQTGAARWRSGDAPGPRYENKNEACWRTLRVSDKVGDSLRLQQPSNRSSLQRSQTDPTLGGLHPVGSSSAHGSHRRPATCSWDTIMPKKQPVRLASGQHSSSPLIRMSDDQEGQSVADDVPFEEWVAMGLPAHQKQPDSLRARRPRTNERISLPCCICRKHASLWCDDCAAAFCAACWPGVRDHDVADLHRA
jgi:hypothetical protein